MLTAFYEEETGMLWNGKSQHIRRRSDISTNAPSRTVNSRQKGKIMEFIAYAKIKCDETDPVILWASEPYADLWNDTVLKMIVKTDSRTKMVKMDDDGMISITRLGKEHYLRFDWKNRMVVGDDSDDIGATATAINVEPETRTENWIK